MVDVIKVESKKQQKEFLNFPLNLYKNNPYFVPPLYADEKKIFKKNYLYNDQSESIFFNAYINNQIVGRISGILQYASNEKWNQKRIRFTRFDSIDNQEVANALFNAIEQWAKLKGMDEIVGPLGYSDLEREGLLVEGFNELSTFEEQYNFEYYQKLIVNCGYNKEIGWVERKIFIPQKIDQRIETFALKMMERYKLRFVNEKNTKTLLKKYANKIFEVIDQTYASLYQTVPCTLEMKKNLVQNFKLLINIKYVGVIVDDEDQVVGFGLCFPSIAKAIQKSGGHLSLLALLRLLKVIHNPKIIDLGLIGITEKYQKKGINAAIIYHLLKNLSQNQILYAETNLNLEDNYNIQNQWRAFDNILHKKRATFVKRITVE